MKLGRRWLYVLWIASTLLWHQAGAAASSASHHLNTAAEWNAPDEDSSSSSIDFTFTGTACLEDQDLTKRPGSPIPAIEHFAEIHTPVLIAVGTVRNVFPQDISATAHAWRLIRGPPAQA
ncbi:MAG TPA: hypothetical protein VL357_09580 [Rariglobus sp.]|jgi:hypothetical protein|nr:hypothetical protein [Rariglobus sp.]